MCFEAFHVAKTVVPPAVVTGCVPCTERAASLAVLGTYPSCTASPCLVWSDAEKTSNSGRRGSLEEALVNRLQLNLPPCRLACNNTGSTFEPVSVHMSHGLHHIERAEMATGLE